MNDSLATKDRLAIMLDKLKDRQCRLTPQRMAILKELALSTAHPTVETVYEKVKANFPTTSRATVYKTINLLKELNEILELGFADSGNRYDGNKPYPHPHLICTQCKKIIDPDLQSLTDMTRELTEETGFKIINHRLDFFGICPECQGAKKS